MVMNITKIEQVLHYQNLVVVDEIFQSQVMHCKEIFQLQELVNITPHMASLKDQIKMGHISTINMDQVDQVYRHLTVHQMSHMFKQRWDKEGKVALTFLQGWSEGP